MTLRNLYNDVGRHVEYAIKYGIKVSELECSIQEQDFVKRFESDSECFVEVWMGSKEEMQRGTGNILVDWYDSRAYQLSKTVLKSRIEGYAATLIYIARKNDELKN